MLQSKVIEYDSFGNKQYYTGDRIVWTLINRLRYILDLKFWLFQ